MCRPPLQSSITFSENHLDLSTFSSQRYNTGRFGRSSTLVGQATMTSVTCQQAIRRRRRHLLRQWMALNRLSRSDLNDLFRSISLEALRSSQSARQNESIASTASENHLCKWELGRAYPKHFGCVTLNGEKSKSSDRTDKRKPYLLAARKKQPHLWHPHSHPSSASPPSTLWFSPPGSAFQRSVTAHAVNSGSARDLWYETEMYMKMFPASVCERRGAKCATPVFVHHHHHHHPPNSPTNHPTCPDQCQWLNECAPRIDGYKPREVHGPLASSAAGPSTACAHSFYHSYEGDPSVDSCSLIPDGVCEQCEDAKHWAVYPQLIKKSGCSCCVCLLRHRSPWPTPEPSERHQTRLSLPHEDSESDSAQSPEIYENLYAV
ncbi:hypothetical protein D915_004437 [Fasciola hepatica]|uniref:Uncharacterized protein n=1 Tax=Fasciola hepatica TaxID=6192 RepID=A0A4E0RAG1_FASHE|nr:hypothetical protein D915_004437 [Fasciola hepatica]